MALPPLAPAAGMMALRALAAGNPEPPSSGARPPGIRRRTGPVRAVAGPKASSARPAGRRCAARSSARRRGPAQGAAAGSRWIPLPPSGVPPTADHDHCLIARYLLCGGCTPSLHDRMAYSRLANHVSHKRPASGGAGDKACGLRETSMRRSGFSGGCSSHRRPGRRRRGTAAATPPAGSDGGWRVMGSAPFPGQKEVFDDDGAGLAATPCGPGSETDPDEQAADRCERRWRLKRNERGWG